MFNKGLLKWIIKAIIACTIAFAMVSGGCLLYYNIPVHYSNSSGATDYKWEAGKFYSKGTEGFALGKINNDGFNNKDDYNGQQIDILFMGSSHGEGFNVAQDKNCVSLLNDKFEGAMYTYNIATSGHAIFDVVSNINNACKAYHPTKYLVVECQSLSTKKENLIAAVEGTLEKNESKSGGLIGFLQKSPFLRLVYFQLSNMSSAQESDANASTMPDTPDAEYIKAVNDFVEKIKNDSETNNVTPIVVYHPHFSIDGDGKITVQAKESYSDLFAKVCNEKGITYIDMLVDFVNGYRNDKKLPYGFSNTAIGEGHLNEYGHSLLADRIYQTIEDMEAAK